MTIDVKYSRSVFLNHKINIKIFMHKNAEDTRKDIFNESLFIYYKQQFVYFFFILSCLFIMSYLFGTIKKNMLLQNVSIPIQSLFRFWYSD